MHSYATHYYLSSYLQFISSENSVCATTTDSEDTECIQFADEWQDE